jgi:ABC-type glycerol-3-phosphate transport system permease component
MTKTTDPRHPSTLLEPASWLPSVSARERIGQVVVLAILIVAAVIAAFPILWAFITSLKTMQENSAWPPSFFPKNPTLANYTDAIFGTQFLRYLWNTVAVVALACALSLTLAAHAAYAVARWNFPGKNVLLLLMWSTIMIPGVAIVVPLYLLAIDLQIYDTLLVLVLVFSAWAIPTLVWLLRGFVASIPRELEEAALIDGCSIAGAFYHITLPLMRPGLLAGSVLLFVMVWNEFLISYALVLSDKNRLVQVGVYYFVTETGIQWGPLMAAAITAIIPIVLVYAVFQRAFIQGVTAGAVKG